MLPEVLELARRFASRGDEANQHRQTQPCRRAKQHSRRVCVECGPASAGWGGIEVCGMRAWADDHGMAGGCAQSKAQGRSDGGRCDERQRAGGEEGRRARGVGQRCCGRARLGGLARGHPPSRMDARSVHGGPRASTSVVRTAGCRFRPLRRANAAVRARGPAAHGRAASISATQAGRARVASSLVARRPIPACDPCSSRAVQWKADSRTSD